MAEGKEEVKGETKAKTKTKEKKAISLDFSGLNAAQREAVMAPPAHFSGRGHWENACTDDALGSTRGRWDATYFPDGRDLHE